MNPYDELFTRLKAGDETRKIARSLHTQASQLTKHGSGRSLRQGHNALLAICAFLASKRLGNGEVTRDQACAVACVDPKAFDLTLSSVEGVLRSASSSPRHSQTSLTYRSLSKQYVAREDAYVPMAEVEGSLKDCGALVDGSSIDLKSPLMQCAIFYWVCTAILRVAIPDAEYLRRMLKVTAMKWSASQRVLETHCSHMMDDLIRKAETALSARKTRSQTQTGTKERVHASLRDLMARPSESPVPLDPLNTAASLSMRSQPTSTSEESENEVAPDETIVVRSARPLRKQFDRNAWDLQKPIWRSPVTPTCSTQNNPSVDVVAFDNTPMTSTGMSDTSSPSLPSHSRAGVRVRFRVPSTAKELSYSVQGDEEMPRRRRRNLRAAFLNPSVYSWKPGARTAKKLERARIWESLMMSKYGDPWETASPFSLSIHV